jgi:hypothetical protein
VAVLENAHFCGVHLSLTDSSLPLHRGLSLSVSLVRRCACASLRVRVQIRKLDRLMSELESVCALLDQLRPAASAMALGGEAYSEEEAAEDTEQEVADTMSGFRVLVSALEAKQRGRRRKRYPPRTGRGSNHEEEEVVPEESDDADKLTSSDEHVETREFALAGAGTDGSGGDLRTPHIVSWFAQ